MSNMSKLSADSVVTITRLSDSDWCKCTCGPHIIHFDPGYLDDFQGDRIPAAELADKATAVLLSHYHYDHYRPQAVAQIADEKTILVGPAHESETVQGNLRLIGAGEEINLAGVAVRAVESYNTPEGSSVHKTHRKGSGVGYVVDLCGVSIYFAGDTDLIPEMARLGKIDVALLPMGGAYVMDPGEALRAVETIRPKIVVPLHQFDHDLQAFADKVNGQGIAKAVVLQVGQSLDVPAQA
jgi:L-ascorbate metabolism protein UlaG (beta-lactamase superfamily)